MTPTSPLNPNGSGTDHAVGDANRRHPVSPSPSNNGSTVEPNNGTSSAPTLEGGSAEGRDAARWILVIAFTALLGLLVAACGSNDSGNGDSGDNSAKSTTGETGATGAATANETTGETTLVPARP